MNDEAYMNSQEWDKVRETLNKLQEVSRPGHEDRAAALAGLFALQALLYRQGKS